MKKLIMEEWISLDGYATDQNGSLDFFTSLSAEQNKYSDLDQLRFLETVDTILMGRKTYELFVEFWPTATKDTEIIADQLNAIPKIVFSNTLKVAPWGKWEPVKIISGDAVKAITDLKTLPGKDMVIWGSLSLVQELTRQSVIDEFHIQLCPVFTGGGRKLFPELPGVEKLLLKEKRSYENGTVFLSYGLQ